MLWCEKWISNLGYFKSCLVSPFDLFFKCCKLEWIRLVHSIMQFNTVQYSTVQYSTVQYSTVQYSTVQYSTVQYSTVQNSTVHQQHAIEAWKLKFYSLFYDCFPC